MSDARPMEPRDAHEIMRSVVEADELDMHAIGRELRGLEAQRDHVVSLAADSDWFAALAAEWQEAYDNARRYVEKTLERRGKLGAVVVDFAIERVASAEREHEVELRLASLERQLSRRTIGLSSDDATDSMRFVAESAPALEAARTHLDVNMQGALEEMERRRRQSELEHSPDDLHPSHRTVLSAEDFDQRMRLYGVHAEGPPGEDWVWCPRTRRTAPAHFFDGRH